MFGIENKTPNLEIPEADNGTVLTKEEVKDILGCQECRDRKTGLLDDPKLNKRSTNRVAFMLLVVLAVVFAGYAFFCHMWIKNIETINVIQGYSLGMVPILIGLATTVKTAGKLSERGSQ